MTRSLPSPGGRLALLLAGLLSLAGACTRTAPPSSSGELTVASPPVDLVILTIIREEYRAVLGKLASPRLVPGDERRPNRFAWVMGEIPSSRWGEPYRVILAMSGEAGTTAGALAARRSLERWRPEHLLVVGIAGGVSESLGLGDVVVSSAVWGYEYGALEPLFDPRHDLTFRCSSNLVTAARGVDSDWLHEVTAGRPDGEPGAPRLWIGQTASGEKVIEDGRGLFAERVLRENPDIISVEMEAAGIAAAVQEQRDAGHLVEWLMIRGISDIPSPWAAKGGDESGGAWQDRDERYTWKSYAADTAAAFAIHLLRGSWPDPPRGEGQS